jgi:hypothetical protein
MTFITPLKECDPSNPNAGKQKPTSTAPSSSKIGGSNIAKWPPASSAKSLPPVSGRISDLLRHQTTSSGGNDNDGLDKLRPNHALGAKDAIEFEVNQECKSFECAEDYNSF